MKDNLQNSVNKKKKIITIILLVIASIMIIIGFFIGIWAYNFVQDFESQNGDIDTSYVDENEKRRRE